MSRIVWLVIFGLVFIGRGVLFSVALAEEPAAKKKTAGQNSTAGEVDFVRDIQPIFAKQCFSCHGPDVQEGGFRLDDKKRAFAGGDSGEAIQAGDSRQSDLIRRVARLDSDLAMPPEGEGEPLSKAQVAHLRRWIDQGAIWPDKPAVASDGSGHWAFQPIQKSLLPQVANHAWPRSPIDLFVLAKLEREGVAPSAQAVRETLIRRLFLDLLGLPPTASQLETFMADRHEGAYERLVDRLLASPHFGERWGKHWLDAARYSDTDGYSGEKYRAHAWRFRSWVIEAMNSDMPFDQFTIEQIAGDLQLNATLNSNIAVGFHRHTLTNRETGTDPEEFRVRRVIDRVNTTGSVWLGMTIACGECHSHKYDPLTQREYYGLYAFFNSLSEVDLPIPTTSDSNKKDLAKIQSLVELSALRTTHVHIRGDFLRKGAEVQPHTPAFLPSLQSREKRADRLDLARWLVSPDNPLTARVAVNRVWQQLFGIALVRTENDFGIQGEQPTHPMLLDYLAARWIEGGWRMKVLIREIVCSATYRQSSTPREDLLVRDPQNRLLARQNRFRVEAEIVRDLFLAAGGILDKEIGGASFRPPVPDGVGNLVQLHWGKDQQADQHRRGMYVVVRRMAPYPMLMTFDAPDANVTCTRRERSNTPLQALTLLNDPTFFLCAQRLGFLLSSDVLQADLSQVEKLSEEAQIRKAFLRCFSRPAESLEVRRMVELLAEQRAFYQTDPDLAKQVVGLWEADDQAGLIEAAAWIAVARVLMNTDEFIMRE